MILEDDDFVGPSHPVPIQSVQRISSNLSELQIGAPSLLESEVSISDNSFYQLLYQNQGMRSKKHLSWSDEEGKNLARYDDEVCRMCVGWRG